MMRNNQYNNFTSSTNITRVTNNQTPSICNLNLKVSINNHSSINYQNKSEQEEGYNFLFFNSFLEKANYHNNPLEGIKRAKSIFIKQTVEWEEMLKGYENPKKNYKNTTNTCLSNK